VLRLYDVDRQPGRKALSMTERDPDAAAKRLANWIGLAWEGIRDGRIAGYPQWAFNGLGHRNFQGGRDDLRDLAREIVSLSHGEQAPVDGEKA
jgi:hypothetical protein